MPTHLTLSALAVRATIPNHFTVPAESSSPSSSDSDTFTPMRPRPPVNKPYMDLWSPVKAVCSRELREKPNGKEGTHYSLGKPFSKGAFGLVFVARALRPNGQRDLVCLKRVVIEKVDPFGSKYKQTSDVDNEAMAMGAAESDLGPTNLMYDIALDDKALNDAVNGVESVNFAYIEEVLCDGNMLYAVDQFDKKHPECLELLVLSMLEQTAKRLGVLHRKGWVHRDIKPDNLLFIIEHEGEGEGDQQVHGGIFVGDYGRGRRMNQQDPRLAGLGTPGFFSLQAAKGPVRPGDDVWALGVTAIEMLMAENPFDPTPYVEHPKDANGNPVKLDDTKLQLPQFQVSLDLLKIYHDWLAAEKKPEGRLTEFFGELCAAFPRVAQILPHMLCAESGDRISCKELHELLSRPGIGLSHRERRKLARAWQDITPHPRIAAQRESLSEAHEPLQHSRTFDECDIPTGFDYDGPRRARAKKGIPADVDGLAEKLTHMNRDEVKASLAREYAQRFPTRLKPSVLLNKSTTSRTGVTLRKDSPRDSFSQLTRPRSTLRV